MEQIEKKQKIEQLYQLIASLDSTAVTASAAIAEINDGKLGTFALFTVKNKLTHSEILLPLLENALTQYGAKIGDVDLFAVSAGPGSFTGLRIGMSAIKGLTIGNGKPCVGVSTLLAMAHGATVLDHIIIGSGGVFSYHNDGNLNSIRESFQDAKLINSIKS